ncbi:hypothetical protein GCM10027403_12270 [Arthrobacter tecti]
MITALARDTPSWHELLRLAFPVLLGFPALPDRHPGWNAGHLGVATPKLGEREVTEALLRQDHHLIPDGQVILGDKGFAGREFETFITEELGATLIRPDRKDEKPRFGKLGGIRQWVESVFDTLKANSA